MADKKYTYFVSFGGGKDNAAWESKTTIEAYNINDAAIELEKQYEGSCSGWGSITVFSIEQDREGIELDD